MYGKGRSRQTLEDYDRSEQWPKTVGSRPAKIGNFHNNNIPPSSASNPDSVGSYSYQYSERNPSPRGPPLQERASSPGFSTTWGPPPAPDPAAYQQHHHHGSAELPTPTVYRAVTPPGSPPSSPPRDDHGASAGLHQAAAVPVSLRVGPRSSGIKPQNAVDLTRQHPPACPSSRQVRSHCICQRGHTTVVCHVCGKTNKGRVRLQCPNHPNTIHLMDFDRCPNCKAVNLMEMSTRPH